MRKIFAIAVLGAILISPLSVGAYNSATAQTYLINHAENPWSTMALAALGTDSISNEYLKSISGTSAIQFTAPILAITALGQDPRTFGTIDYVAKLESYSSAGQIGDPATINDDIFGLLALISAGAGSDQVAIDAKNFILAHQQSNGGWGFATSSNTDSNMSAAAIVALLASGISSSDAIIQNALNYLKSAQNDDGGFTYDPQSSFGTDSDSSSTAWVLWALNAAGIDQASWAKSAHTPLQYLESNQDAGGFFKYQSSSSEDSFSATTTAYAVIALTGKTLPLRTISTASTFEFRIQGKSSTVCIGKTTGPTALDIVKNAAIQCGFTYHIQSTSFGPYLDQINEDKAEGLIGWLYQVNSNRPNIGAGEYNLKTGDTVLWYYGSGDQADNSVGLKVNIQKGQVQGSAISFVVDPTNLDFGILNPGQSNNQSLSLKNTGDTAIEIKSNVSGDDVFVQNLTLDLVAWQTFQKNLAKGQSSAVDVKLTVPANYSGNEGNKTGIITFWATVK